MTKTVLLAGIYHETHTFLRQKTSLGAFRSADLALGNEVIEKNRGNGSPTDGFLSYAAARKWTIVPAVQMAAMPSGIVLDEATDFFRSHFFDALAPTVHQIDAIYLVLHGAMVSQSCDDVEGELICEIREFLVARGVDIPLVGVIDLHANVTKKMTDNSTCLYSYRKNPHSDARDAAVQAAALLDGLMADPCVKQVHLGTEFVIPPTGLGTSCDPMKSVLARARAIEAADPDILCINVMGGYAYADIADCGFSLNCCTRGEQSVAMGYLNRLLDVLKDHLPEAYPSEAKLETVLHQIDRRPRMAGPIVLIEPADNIGGGTPGDGTGVLAPLLASGRSGIVAIINDPQAVAQCAMVGLNAGIELEIGAKTDAYHGRPVAVKAVVQHLSEGKFELENKKSHLASMMGTRIDMGKCAVIKNRQATILLTSCKTPPMDLGQLHSQGIMPEEARFIIVKAAVAHKDAYDPIAAESFYIDSTGLCTSNLKTLPYRKLAGKRIAAPNGG